MKLSSTKCFTLKRKEIRIFHVRYYNDSKKKPFLKIFAVLFQPSHRDIKSMQVDINECQGKEEERMKKTKEKIIKKPKKK